MLNIQKKYNAFRLCLALIFCVSLVSQEPAKRKVAIPEPHVREGIFSVSNIENARATIEDFVVNSSGYTVVDRNYLDSLIKEHSFQVSAFSDPSKAKELGKIAGADLVCVITLMRDGDESSVSARIIDVESGEIANSGRPAHFTGTSTAALMAATERLASNLLPQLKEPETAIPPRPDGMNDRQWRAYQDRFNKWLKDYNETLARNRTRIRNYQSQLPYPPKPMPNGTQKEVKGPGRLELLNPPVTRTP
jgi:hypothetical protein